MPFNIPVIDDNEEGWGPATIPDQYKEVPYYAPYSKGDKLGKAADWQQQYQGKGTRYQKEKTSESTSTIFNWQYQDDDSTFQLVDSTRAQTKRVYGRRGFQNRGYQQVRQMHQKGQSWQNQPQQVQKGRQLPKAKQNLNRNWNYRPPQSQQNIPARKKEPSIEVKPDWKEIETIEFSALNKASGEEAQAQDITTAGFSEYYNKAYDRVSTRGEKPLERTDRTFFNVSTSDDPVIRQLASDGVGNVFGTDVILAHLMAATRSVQPWDIIIHRAGQALFFDKDGSQLDFVTVNETSADPLETTGINSAASLSREATFINQVFSQQVLQKDEQVKFEKENPFQSEGEKVAAVGYKYRKWKISDDITLVARCEVDGLVKTEHKDLNLSIKALNEFDLKTTDWRKRIDTQKGAVLATELKNNANKLTKWTLQALLAGNDSFKLGYVSRVSAKDNSNHVILGVQDYTPKEFATQIGLNHKNVWGVLRRLIETCMKLPTGKYIIMRDPDRNALKLYAVPDDSSLGHAKGVDNTNQ